MDCVNRLRFGISPSFVLPDDTDVEKEAPRPPPVPGLPRGGWRFCDRGTSGESGGMSLRSTLEIEGAAALLSFNIVVRMEEGCCPRDCGRLSWKSTPPLSDGRPRCCRWAKAG